MVRNDIWIRTSKVTKEEHKERGLSFIYRDKDGEESVRNVTRMEFFVDKEGRQYLNAWDHGRQGFRSFLLENIVSFPKIEV